MLFGEKKHSLLKLIQRFKNGNSYREKAYRTLHPGGRNNLATQWVHLVSCQLLHVHYVMLSPALGLCLSYLQVYNRLPQNQYLVITFKNSFKDVMQMCLYTAEAFLKNVLVSLLPGFLPRSPIPSSPSIPGPTFCRQLPLDAGEARLDCNENPVPV